MKRIADSCVLVMGLFAVAGCKQTPVQVPSVSYQITQVSTSDVTVNEMAVASLTGQQDIAIIPQVSGFITKVNVVEGQKVKKGDILFELDQVQYKAALAVAVANVASAKANVSTQELNVETRLALYNDSIISQYELQMAENALMQAKASLAQAQAGVVNANKDLSYTVLTAPCDGVIGSLPYREGSLVGPSIQTPLTTVSNNANMFAYFGLTESVYIELINNYGSVNDALKMCPDVQLELVDKSIYSKSGRIESISGVIDKSTGTLSSKAVFPNQDGKLVSGGSARVILPIKYSNIIVIPNSATYEIQDKTYVWVVEDKRAHSRIVEAVDLGNGTQCAILSGLKTGERIIADGAGYVTENEIVEDVDLLKKMGY